MTDYEKLVELIDQSLKRHIDKSCKLAENIASDLMAGGVTLPPVTVGQKVYQTDGVQEVRHGRWITKDLDNFRMIECKCSECGYIGISNYDSYDDPYDFNFCPNCGAMMDVGDTKGGKKA